jgi:spore coat polysaccharide biosynthesis protein SpsF
MKQQRARRNAVLGIVQARMGSSRLPGKVLMSLGGTSVLGWVLRAARESNVLDDLVVATTVEAVDDEVVAAAERFDVEVVRGPVDDVLSRFDQALGDRPVDAVARFTADCPLLDPALIAAAVNSWKAAPWLDYVSTAMPRRLPRGMDVEVVRAEVLRSLAQRSSLPAYHRTHVTSAIYSEPEGRQLLGLAFAPDASDLRVTLDTADDWRLIQALVDKLGDRPARLPDVVAYLRAHPNLTAINQHIRQKPLEQG